MNVVNQCRVIQGIKRDFLSLNAVTGERSSLRLQILFHPISPLWPVYLHRTHLEAVASLRLGSGGNDQDEYLSLITRGWSTR